MKSFLKVAGAGVAASVGILSPPLIGGSPANERTSFVVMDFNTLFATSGDNEFILLDILSACDDFLSLIIISFPIALRFSSSVSNAHPLAELIMSSPIGSDFINSIGFILSKSVMGFSALEINN